MATFVALLRAVNVSGQNTIAMAELRRALGEAGFAAVESYVQSGNLVFEADGDVGGAQAARVHDVVASGFGYDVAVVALTAADLAAVVGGNPFLSPSAPPVAEKALHVTFLERPVEEAPFGDRQLPAAPGESAALGLDGRCVYLRLPHGYGRSKLNNAWFERTLGVRATTRNWRTVVALAAMSAREG